MEKLIHTSDGKLKQEGPILSSECRDHEAYLDHEPVPCAYNSKELCQCRMCVKHNEEFNG